jgi:hypothetical protein
VTATSGAAVATGNTIHFDESKLAAVTIYGTDLKTATGLQQHVAVFEVAKLYVGSAGNQATDTVYLGAGTFSVTDTFPFSTYGGFTIAPDASGALAVTATSGAAVATGNTIHFDESKLAAVTIYGTDLTDGLQQSVAVEEVVTLYFGAGPATDTAYLGAGTFHVDLFGGPDYGTFTVAANASGSLAVTANSGAAVVTGNTIHFDVCSLNQVQITAPSVSTWSIDTILGSGTHVVALPDGSYTLGINGPSGLITATFSVGPSGLSATQFPQDAPLVTLQLVPCQDETTTTIASSVNPSLLNQPVTLTANVTVQDGDVPTGTVQFLIEGANFGLPVTLTNGVASITTATLGLGPHTISAVYSGGGEFVGSTGSATVSVIPPAILSGVVWEDFNDDGQVDFGENGISGVKVTLTGTDDLGNAVTLSQLTDGDGAYVFLNLRPGSYYLTEAPPAGYLQGIDSVGTAGGRVSAADQFLVSLGAGVNGLNYNFGELPPAGGSVQPGQTATIGFWNNKNGQALINALNDGTGTQLADWLAATLPNTFGRNAGNSDVAGQSNAYIAALFQQAFVMKGVKLDAQLLAMALSVYATNITLDPTAAAAQYGFTVSGDGAGTATFNVGSNGDAFGAANNTTLTLMNLLLAADGQAVNGVLYNGNTTRRNEANAVFSAVNQAGDI